MTLSITPLAFLLMQVGINPAVGGMPGIPDELANRPPREQVRPAAVTVPEGQLAPCLRQAASEPEAALNTAQAWREQAANDLEMAQSAHCLGLALVSLNRFTEAKQAFELASGEAPAENLAYSARLAAMAGNAAMAAGDAEAALPLLDIAGGKAEAAGDLPLKAGLRVDLARVLVKLDRPEDAAAALKEAREADGDNAQAWLLSATLSRRMDQLADAQAQIERAALLAPRDPAVGLEAGVIAALAGRNNDARGSFESVIAVAPECPLAERARDYLAQLDASQ